MRGWKRWLSCASLVATACGGRSALDNPDLSAAARGGARASGGAPATMGGAPATSTGGVNARGGAPGAAGMATGGMASAGAPATPVIATSISAGTAMSCATLSDGSVWCWGSNENGQLGDGTMTSPSAAVRVMGIDNAQAVTAGGTWNSGGMGAANSAFGCALLSDGTIRCWGRYNPILDRTDPSASLVPVTIPGITEAVAVAGGNGHACALSRGGAVTCWGDNSRGELGDHSMADSTAKAVSFRLVPTPGIADATAVAAHG